MKNRHLNRTHYRPQSHGSAEAEAEFAQAGRRDERRTSSTHREAQGQPADTKQRESERAFTQSPSSRRSQSSDDRRMRDGASRTPKGAGAKIPTVIRLHQPWFDGALSALTNNLIALLIVPIIISLVWISPKMKQVDVGPGGTVPNLSSIKIVQMPDANSARQRVQRDAPVMTGMFHDWETAHQVAIAGSEPDVLPILIPLPRSGFENDFKNLQHAGLGNVWLNLFFPPMSGLREFDKQLASWAKKCRVPKSLIKRWSTLRNAVTGARDAFCRPGGMCVMLSFGPCGESKSPNEGMEAGFGL